MRLLERLAEWIERQRDAWMDYVSPLGEDNPYESPGANGPMNDNVIIGLDFSTSIAPVGAQMSLGWRTMIKKLQARRSMRVSLYSVNRNVHRLCECAPPTKLPELSVVDFKYKVHEGGKLQSGSSLCNFLCVGIDEALALKQRRLNGAVFLIADGLPTDDDGKTIERLRTALRSAREKKIPVFVSAFLRSFSRPKLTRFQEALGVESDVIRWETTYVDAPEDIRQSALGAFRSTAGNMTRIVDY